MDSAASSSPATDAQAIALELDQLQREAEASIAQADGVVALEPLRIKCLGRKSRLSEIMKLLGSLGSEQRALVGKRANAFKTAIEDSLQARQQRLLAAPSAHTNAASRNTMDAFSQKMLRMQTVNLMSILTLVQVLPAWRP